MRHGGWTLMTLGLVLVFGFLGWTMITQNPLGELSGGTPFTTVLLLSGVVLSAVLGGVLMWLAFRSSKRGFDERAGRYGDDDQPPPPPR